MSITPTVIIPSASPRPYGGAPASPSLSTGARQDSPFGGNDSPFGGNWVCCDHMSIHVNPTTGTTFGSKRLDPGSFAGGLT